MKYLRILILALVVFTSDIVVGRGQAYAASQDECAIWLCLPSGFPSGCSAAHSAMINRLKSRKSPLPAFSSCASEGRGNYKIGIENFEACKEGFDFYAVESYSNKAKGICVNNSSKCRAVNGGYAGYVPKGLDCTTYNAVLRPKPHFIEMLVNDDYMGKFFYR